MESRVSCAGILLRDSYVGWKQNEKRVTRKALVTRSITGATAGLEKIRQTATRQGSWKFVTLPMPPKMPPIFGSTVVRLLTRVNVQRTSR